MSENGSQTCVVLQPGYLPWLGFFEQMSRADVFVYLDDVQFDKNGWRNRNRIKGPAGPQWLTVPVRLNGLSFPPINQVLIDPTQHRWAAKHLQALKTNYGPCPFFDWLFPDIEKLLSQPWTHIAELDIALVELLCDKISLRRRINRSSVLKVEGDRCGRLVEFCRQLNCDTYYSGAAARDYMDTALFEQAGIKVVFQDYRHPQYTQRFGEFVPYLSVVDLLFNCGPQSSKIIVQDAVSAHCVTLES